MRNNFRSGVSENAADWEYILSALCRDAATRKNLKQPIIIAIDGTSASGKSTNAKLVARALGYVYVDTGAMYRTLAWHCLQKRIDVHDAKAVAAACRKWKT